MGTVSQRCNSLVLHAPPKQVGPGPHALAGERTRGLSHFFDADPRSVNVAESIDAEPVRIKLYARIPASIARLTLLVIGSQGGGATLSNDRSIGTNPISSPRRDRGAYSRKPGAFRHAAGAVTNRPVKGRAQRERAPSERPLRGRRPARPPLPSS